MTKNTQIGLAAGIFLTCVTLNGHLEGDLVTHVLVQLPLLAISGALFVPDPAKCFGDWNRYGVTTLVVAVAAIAFWMLPRSIDAALTSNIVKLSKFATVPLLIGAALKITWQRAHPLLRGFLKAEAISMMLVLAFLFTHAPIRLCNAYLLGDQQRLGYGFLVAALVITILWSAPLFVDQRSTSNQYSAKQRDDWRVAARAKMLTA